jgi:predicted exporter
LSPKLSTNITTQEAISKLSDDIQRRFIIVIKSKQKKNIEEATNYFKAELIKNRHVLIDNTESIVNILATLKPYRFQLLSPEQRVDLTTSSTDKILEKTQRQLFRIENSLAVSRLKDDPLNTFGNYINYLLDNDFSQKSSDPLFSIVSVYIKDDLTIKDQTALAEKINLIKDHISSKHDANILKSGVFFFAEDAAKKSESDIKFISIISSISIICLLLIVFRSLLLLTFPFLSICIGILFAISINFYFYGYIHLLTIVFGSSLIGIIIDYSLHYFYHIKTSDAIALPERSFTLSSPLYRAMLFSLITSVIGYGALSFSNLDILKKIALFSCGGILASWVSVITLGRFVNINSYSINDIFFTKINTYFIKVLLIIIFKLSFKLSYTLWALILFLSVFILTIFPIKTNDNPRLFFNPPKNLIEQEKIAAKLNQNFEPGQYLILSGESISEIYATHNKFLAYFSSAHNRTISNTSSNTSFFCPMEIIPSPTIQKENYQLQNKIYEPSGIAEKLFTSLGFPNDISINLFADYSENFNQELSPEILFNRNNNLPPLWSSNGKNFHISFMLIKKGSNLEYIRKASLEFDNIQYFDTLSLSQEALAEQRSSSSNLLVLAYALISVILYILYRDYKILFLLFIPLTGTLFTLLIFKLFNIDFTLFHSMGFFLILGLGMDYGIFIKEMSSNKKTIVNSNTHDTTLNAILFSAITTLFSFGLLALSAVPVAKAFGLTLLIGNTINFFSALVYGLLLERHLISSLTKEK